MVALSLPVRRRRAFDPRILLGIVLVLGSAFGVTALVAALDRSVVVYRADQALVAGDRVTAADLTGVPVRLGDAQRMYLSGRLPAGGLVVTRTVAAGELLPLSALGNAADVTTATVVVSLGSRIGDGIGAGTVVDLWSAEPKEGATNRFAAPVVLVDGATVRRLVQPTGIISAAQQNTVELQVPRSDVAAVLQAVADGAQLSAVAVSQPVTR